MDDHDIDPTMALLLSVKQADDRESQFLDFVAMAQPQILGPFAIHLNRVIPECDDWQSVFAVQIPLILKEFTEKSTTDQIASLRNESRKQPDLGIGQLQFEALSAAAAQRHAECWGNSEGVVGMPLENSQHSVPCVPFERREWPPIRLFETSVIMWETKEPIDSDTHLPERTLFEFKRNILRERLRDKVAYHFRDFDPTVCDDLADRAIAHYEDKDRVKELIKFPVEFVWQWRLYGQAKKYKMRKMQEAHDGITSDRSGQLEELFVNPAIPKMVEENFLGKLDQILRHVDDVDCQVAIARFWDELTARLTCQKLYYLGYSLKGATAIDQRRRRLFEKLKDLVNGGDR